MAPDHRVLPRAAGGGRLRKSYGRAYFDRWYRSPDSPLDGGPLRRNVSLAVAVAESVLGRPLATVLDVGCGEGRWQPVLGELRPDAAYLGIEPSEYAVERFGGPRNLRRGSFQELGLHVFDEPFDLVVCSDVLHYLTDEEILAGLDAFVGQVGGAALVEVFTARDPVLGDREEFHEREPSWYRRAFRDAGLVPLGLQMYVTREMGLELDAMDLPSGL